MALHHAVLWAECCDGNLLCFERDGVDVVDELVADGVESPVSGCEVDNPRIVGFNSLGGSRDGVDGMNALSQECSEDSSSGFGLHDGIGRLVAEEPASVAGKYSFVVDTCPEALLTVGEQRGNGLALIPVFLYGCVARVVYSVDAAVFGACPERMTIGRVSEGNGVDGIELACGAGQTEDGVFLVSLGDDA